MYIAGQFQIESYVEVGGLVLRNTVTETMRNSIASFLRGDEISPPTHIAVSSLASLATENAANKDALNAEIARAPITSKFLQGSDTVRYTAVFGTNFEGVLRQFGLFSDTELWAVVDAPQGLTKDLNTRINVYWFLSMTRGGAELALTAFDRQQLNVTSNAVSRLTTSRFQPTGGAAPARQATVYIRSGTINYTLLGDANVPTTSSGIGPITQMNEWSDAITIDGLTNIANFRVTAVSGPALVEVDYYR